VIFKISSILNGFRILFYSTFMLCVKVKCSESATLLSYFSKQGDETLFKAKDKFLKKVKHFDMFLKASLIFVAQRPIHNNLSVISHSRKQKKNYRHEIFQVKHCLLLELHDIKVFKTSKHF